MQLLPVKLRAALGIQVHMEKPSDGAPGELIGVGRGRALSCTACTVSGGGNSGRSQADHRRHLAGPVFVRRFQRDFDRVARVDQAGVTRDASSDRRNENPTRRPVLSFRPFARSVIKLLTPASREYHREYNGLAPLHSAVHQGTGLRGQARLQPDWGENWRDHFSVNVINGTPGNELKCDNRQAHHHLTSASVTTPMAPGGSSACRKDFHPAAKLQLEDDITASSVFSIDRLKGLNPQYANRCVKFVTNCETLLFQRPD